jgi:hypothetical protein
VLTIGPSSCIASAQVLPAVPIQTDPLLESSGGFSDPLFNTAGKALHPDAAIVKHEARWFQLKEVKQLKKTAKKLAEQCERERLAKENEEQRKKNERLEQLMIVKEKLGGDIDALLSEKLERPFPSTPAPILQGVQAMAVPVAGENFLKQESPFNLEKFVPGQLIPNVQSYLRVENNSLVPLLKSILLMAIDPPTLSALPLLIQHSPIVGRVLTFDEMEGVHDQQTSSYPRVEDTSSLDRRPSDDAAMEDVAEISGVAASDDHVDIEFVLRNANLDCCKDALPSLRSSQDNEDDGGHEKQLDTRLYDHLNITGVVSTQASPDHDSIHPDCSRQGGQDPHTQEECNMSLDVVDYEMDVYEVVMCDPSDGGTDAFFLLEHSSTTASIPRDKVHLFFPVFHNVKMRFVPCCLFFFSYLCSIH